MGDFDNCRPHTKIGGFLDAVYTEASRRNELFELSFQLSNVVYTLLNEVIDYCHENNIPIREATGIWNLMNESKNIFKQIEEVSSPNYRPPKLPRIESIRRKFTSEKSDEDFTEPETVTLK